MEENPPSDTQHRKLMVLDALRIAQSARAWSIKFGVDANRKGEKQTRSSKTDCGSGTYNMS